MKKVLCCFYILCCSLWAICSYDFYWENPLVLASNESQFPSSAYAGNTAVTMWQEVQRQGSDSGRLYLSARIYTGTEWIIRSRFAGPFAYAGEIPSIASVAINNEGVIAVAALSGTNSISIFTSNDFGAHFKETRFDDSAIPLIAPRIYTTSDDGFMLFVTQATENNFLIKTSRSSDGLSWSDIAPFEPATALSRSFLPVLIPALGSDLVVFQAVYYNGYRYSHQLYTTYSENGGITWSQPRNITDFSDSKDSTQVFSNFHNQRADIRLIDGKIHIVWERSSTSTELSQIYYAQLSNEGALSSVPELISINAQGGTCNNPLLFDFNSTVSVLWSDNHRGIENIYLSQKTGAFWDEMQLSKSSFSASFARPLILSTNNSGKVIQDLHVVWQQALSNGTQRVVMLSPDRTALPPLLRAASFTEGRRYSSETVQIDISFPDDSSGFAAYSYIWTQDATEEPPYELSFTVSSSRLRVQAREDGYWYLKARTLDYAGNWSKSSSIAYFRDTTPPELPLIKDLAVDNAGFLPSNTFTFQWSPFEHDTDIAGYSYALQYLSDMRVFNTKGSLNFDSILSQFTLSRPVSRIMTTGTTASFSNRDNGMYAFLVSAIDSVGNVSEPSIAYFFLNKYIPYTIITYANTKTDEFGSTALTLIGRGYTTDGTIQTIYIDRDGKAPYDATFELKDVAFTINSDKQISGITFSDLDEGSYRVGLMHSSRGLYFSPALFSVSQYGTVKIGDFSYTYESSWRAIPANNAFKLQFADILIISLCLFAVCGAIGAVWGIVHVTQDSIQIQNEVQALLTGDYMPSQKKKKAATLRRKGVSLKFKLAFFTATLVVMIVLLVSVPLGYQMTKTQQATLAVGLQERVFVLLDSLSTSARAFLPSQNILELSFLPDQSKALPEARHATITGFSAADNTVHFDHLWATNDPAIMDKLDMSELIYGKSRVIDEVSEALGEKWLALNEKAIASISDISEGLSTLNAELRSLTLKTDNASVQRRDEIQSVTKQLNEKLNTQLTALAEEGKGSYPAYDSSALSRDTTMYTFYKPILYRQGSESNFVRGVVRVDISTDALLKSLDTEHRKLVGTTIFVGLFAVAIGIIGSLILASIIVSPIRRLAGHVAMIRDTDDKETLHGKDIRIRSRDEIGTLGEIINDMTHGLVKAASAAKDLTVGKEVQKMFIPLDVDSSGKKLTSGSSSDENAEFFGYYEGAKGVSGDYFDYIKLDNRHFAVIKCDIAGKGVPAALIMVEVATLFLNYFKDWNFKKNGYKIDILVSQINDLIESRGFKGRFAAFTLCIFDSVSGDVYFCNAGDNLVHIYDTVERKKKTIVLPEVSAAGVFPSFMVEMKGGFKVVKQHLKHGDVLFFYTDGIEEAKRMFRDANLKNVICAEHGLEKDMPHESHSVGQGSEEMGPERVNAIIEAVFAGRVYTLQKWHNPIENELLEFDFSTCEGSLEDVIMALVSVEKIFRMYRDSHATEFDLVQVDRKVDAFLNLHFLQYADYCSNRKDHPLLSEYLYYTCSKEDAQYDDLTILAARKK